MKNNKKWLSIVLTAIVVTFVCVVGMPVSANGASVTRGLPEIVKTTEEFAVTLTQSGFFVNAGFVNETLPEGFTYVPDSLTGNASVYSYDETANHLTIDFEDETIVTYNVTASSYDQIPAEFSGTYKTFTGSEVETGNVGGNTDVVVDGTPPYTEGHDPAPGATDVPVDTNITVHIKDNFMVTAMEMTVEEEIVTPDITGGINHYTLTYNPSVDFGHGQVVNVTIDAYDLAGNAMTTDSYSFTTDPPVTEKPDLVITEKWVCWPYNCTICYNMTNIGNGTAPAGHNTTLFVDGTEKAHDQVTEDLVHNASYIGCFEDAWLYSPPEGNITVCADNDETVDELIETNNCLTNILVCGDVNGDGNVTGYDDTLLALYIGEVPGWTITNMWAADVNGDGDVTGYDDTVLALYIGEVPGWEPNCKCSG